MNKEFEAYYASGYAWIFFALAAMMLIPVVVLAILRVFLIPVYILLIGVAVIFLCVFAGTICQKGVAVEITDGRLILHKKKLIVIPLAEIYRISINDGNGSFDLAVKTVHKNYSIHCFIKEERKKKQEFIRLFKNRGIEVQTFDLTGD
jgi:hypothetical protein